MIDNRNRTFHYAVLASLALHALLLFALPDIVDTARRAASIPPQIIARLMEPEPPAPAPEIPVEQTKREPPAKKVAKPTAPPAMPKAPPVLSAPPPAPQPVPPASAAAPAAPPEPPVAAVEPPPAAPPESAPQAAQAPPPPAQAPEALSRDQYRLQLIDEARRHRRYPQIARDNNWEGVVGVSVAVAPNGRPAVTIKRSSGYEVLDQNALQMFAQAARTVPVPPALRGTAFTVDLPVRYNLED